MYRGYGADRTTKEGKASGRSDRHCRPLRYQCCIPREIVNRSKDLVHVNQMPPMTYSREPHDHEAGELHGPYDETSQLTLAFTEGVGLIHMLRNNEQGGHIGVKAIQEQDSEADKQAVPARKKLVWVIAK